ncbi:tape measure protein [Trichlorobacter lovleyi]|uniref:tape measure protein n=1 Tax=Trichlorobacter lovleyi TaxID=313985 RepID=UPI003D138929
MGNNPTVKVTIEGDNLLSADLKQIESEFLQVEQAGKKTASAVSALFTSMDDEQFSVQATWQRAMDDVKAATAQAVDAANREIANLGKNISSDRLAGSFKDLGIRSALDISTEKARLVAAFQAIKKSGVASADEIRRAEVALQEQLQKIDGALDNNKRKSNEATGGIATGLKGVAAWLAAAFSVDRVVAFTKAAFEASMAVDAIVGQLKVMTGSDQAAAEELSFIRVEANRLGLDLLETSKSYGSFMTAVKGTANEGKQSRAMFIGITEGMNAVRMSADGQAHAWTQLNQGIMKGKFEMQDLKAINEAGLPIFKLLAEALGVSTAEILRMQTEGSLLADDALPKLAESMHKTYGVAAVEAASKGRAELNKFNTAVFELKAYLAQSFDGNGLGALTGLVERLKSVVLYAQLGKIEIVALFEKFSALVDNGGLIGLMGGGKEARDDLKEQFAAIDAMTELSIKKRREQYTNWSAAAKQAEKDVAGAAQAGTVQTREEAEKAGKIRRDNAKKAGEDLAKINVEFAKQTGDAEAQLTADLLKQYEERKKATIDFWNQKKAAAKDNIEEASYEIIKNQKLQQIEAQHLRDVEIIQAAAKSRRLDSLKDEIALETLLVQEKVAKNEMTTAQGERRITELTVAAAKAQYDAKKATTDAYVGIYGKQGEDYKKLLKDQDSAHKEYLTANLSAYKSYADNIKAIDQQIRDVRASFQDKIRDIQQKGMTDSQKYADNQKRYDEAVSASRAALAAKDAETATKYAKQAEEMAVRLADKQATGNTELEKQAALQEGVAISTRALSEVEALRVQILESQKKENQDALAALEKIRDMKLDPKNLAVNIDQGALATVKSELDALTKDATKTIYIKTVGASGEASYSNTGGATEGFFTGGKVTNGSPLQDSVHAMLARNEWVINNKAAGFWGDNLLAAVNAPFSAAGMRLQQTLNLSAPTQPNVVPMGSIDLTLPGGPALQVQAPINVIDEFNRHYRRLKMTRPQ